MTGASTDPGERLQKILARAGIASRRAAEELIREGRVTVNGEVAVLGRRADPARDAVKVDGKRVVMEAPSRYLILNKPEGYITSRSDPENRPTVFDLVPPRLRRGLVAVGRLDFQSEGLLLLTDDGDFANQVAHPSHGCLKTYAVKVKGRPGAGALERVRRGGFIAGRRTAPVDVRPFAVRGRRKSQENSWWEVRITEGRQRQIRELFFRAGHPVMRLRRTAIGKVTAPELPPGRFRELTEREIALLGGRGG